jgi:hypothetical protein
MSAIRANSANIIGQPQSLQDPSWMTKKHEMEEIIEKEVAE